MIVSRKKAKYFLAIILFLSFLNKAWSSQITITKPNKVIITGIGILVNNQDIATSFSAVRDCKEVSVMFGKKIYPAKVISSLEITKGNLALIRTNLDVKDFILLQDLNSKPQDKVFIGNVNKDLKLFNEIEARVNFVGSSNYNIEFENRSVKKGNSGSPIYNEKGYMVGILTGIASSDDESEYVNATSMKTIQNFAETYNIELSKPEFYGNDLKLKFGFFDNFAVNISCFNRDKNGVLEQFGSFGTGVFINPNYVITNAHVVKNCSDITVSTKNNIYQGSLVAALSEKKGDLAFIKTDANRTNYAFVEDDSLFVGQKIFFPSFTSQTGTFIKEESNITFFGNKNHGLEIVLPKESDIIFGAPVFNEKGNLAALMAMNLNYNLQEKLVIATPVSVLKDFALINGVPLYMNNDLSPEKTSEERAKSLVKIICQ